MSRVRNSDTALEKLLCEELTRNGVTTYTRNNKTIFGKPDIAFIARKIAVFCDGDFWHGYDWANAQDEIKVIEILDIQNRTKYASGSGSYNPSTRAGVDSAQILGA